MATKAELLQKFFGCSTTQEAREKYPRWGRFNPPPGTRVTVTEFPYQRDLLLRPIPTPHDIAKVLKAGDLTGGRPWGVPVVRVNDVYAVKFSQNSLILREAENMLYIEQHTSVRTPMLYAAYSDSSGNPMGEEHNGETWYYIVMEYISGTTLAHVWDDMPIERRQEVALEFTEQLRRLRAAAIPSGSDPFYGRVYHQSIPPRLALLAKGEGMRGPYASYHDLLSDMFEAAQISEVISNWAPDMHPLAADHLARFVPTFAGKGQRPTLTHTDLKLSNIMYREDKVGGLELIILDWEDLCWLPEWMEAGSILERCLGADSILKMLDQVYSPSDMEAARFLRECNGMIAYFLNI